MFFYDFETEEEKTAWLEGACLGAWASVFICDWLDKEEEEED